MAGEAYANGSWGRLDWWHQHHAVKLAKYLLVLRELALMRDAAEIDIDRIEVAIGMAERLAKGGDE